MFPDLSQMEEFRCSECGKPPLFMPKVDDPNRLMYQGCRCNRKEADILPDGILFGPVGSPMTLWVTKPKLLALVPER